MGTHHLNTQHISSLGEPLLHQSGGRGGHPTPENMALLQCRKLFVLSLSFWGLGWKCVHGGAEQSTRLHVSARA